MAAAPHSAAWSQGAAQHTTARQEHTQEDFPRTADRRSRSSPFQSPFQIAINRSRAAPQSISIRVVPPSSFSHSFVFLWFVAFLAYLSFQLTTGSLPLFALTLGADDAAIGLLTGVIALVSLVSRPWVGWWLDRGGARWGMLAAGCLYTPSAAGFWAARTVPALIGFRVLSGLAIALSSTSAQVLAIAMAPERRRGEALSLLGLANSIGQGVGPAAGIAVAGGARDPRLFATRGVTRARRPRPGLPRLHWLP